MKNNKMIFVAILLALVMAGGGFYFGKMRNSGEPDLNLDDDVVPPTSSEINDMGFAESYLGNPDAPVIMIDYASFLCGHCIAFHKETLPALKKKYIDTGKVKFIFRPYPPVELSESTYCAQDQGKFWEFSDYLFENISKLQSVDDLKIFAGDAGLDVGKFGECFDSKKYEERAKSVFEKGKVSGVSGTPTFFINGEKVVGNVGTSEFEKIIDAQLAK